MKHLTTIFILSLCFTSCASLNKDYQRNKEARDDATKMQSALKEQALVPHTILVDAETEPVNSPIAEDAADDPGIYYNNTNPENSVIIGTDKNQGLYSYNLKGEQLDFHPTGKVNNVNVLKNFPYNGRKINLVAATNRTSQTISILELKEFGEFGEKLTDISTNVDDVYGFTAFQTNDKFYVISNGKNGVIEQFEIFEKNGTINSNKILERKVISQPEGMVVDTITNKLFVGVEEKYIQVFNATENTDELIIINSSVKENNPFISYDIEGLALFHYNEKSYLVASIQGSFSFAIFNVTTPNKAKYITSFALSKNNSIDGVEETDGLEIELNNFGGNYPEGILVVQDGFNKDASGNAEAQNFKIVDIRKILQLLK